jgi:hypothetical protein
MRVFLDFATPRLKARIVRAALKPYQSENKKAP